MKSVFAKARWKWLRMLLVVLLPLHVGFAQAAMSAAPVGHTQSITVADEGMLMPDGVPCHHEANASAAADQSHQHKGGCCDAGNCHCAAACVLCFAIARIKSQPGMIEPPFSFLSVPDTARPPDLRPPIT